MELINFLKELYNDTTISDNQIELLDEVHILDLNLTDLWDSLRNKWGFLDKSALNVFHTAEDYYKRKNEWKKIVKDSKKLSDLDFVLKYGGNYLTSMHDAGILDEQTINFEKDHIIKKPYPIALELEGKFLDWGGQKIYSFKIHEEHPFRVNLHIKHEKRIFHELLLFFSISVENPKKKVFSIEFINNFYRSLILAYEIIKFLELENYRKASVRIEDYTTYDSSKSDFFLDYLKSIPFLFNVFFIDLIGFSLHSLFNLLSSQLEKIQELFTKFELVNQPAIYYSKFEEQIKEFIEQGNHLFQKAGDLIYTSKISEKKSLKKQEKKPSLTEEKLIELFQLEFDQDLHEEVDNADMGFRSLPNINKKYGKRLGISWKTFSDKALNIIKRSPRFETRKRMKSGGGLEFRVKPTEFVILKEKILPVMQFENYEGENYETLMEYEQAKILHEDGKIGKAVEIFERLLTSYDDKSHKYSFIYCDICYRLGLIYEIHGYLDDAVRVYITGQQNRALSDPISYSFDIALFKTDLLKGNLGNLLNKITDLEKTIKKTLKQDLMELNSKYQYIDGCNLEDLDIVYIRDLKRDMTYSQNPVFQEVVQLDEDLLHLQVLKLDLIRRDYYYESLRHLEIDTQIDEIYFKQSTSDLMRVLLEQSEKILTEVNKNKFNYGNKSFVLFRLYKTFFEQVQFDDRGFDYGYTPDTFFPYYYTKYLFDIANYTSQTERHIFERLDKGEFVSLDSESQVEYLIKFCVSNWRGYAFGTIGYNTINIYKNMKTLIDHAKYLVKKYELIHFYKIIKEAQPWMEKMVENFIVGYYKIAERIKNREVRKL